MHLELFNSSEASKKVSFDITTSEVVPEADTTDDNARNKKGCMDEDLVVHDQAAGEGFSTEEPLIVEVTSCDSLDPIFS